MMVMQSNNPKMMCIAKANKPPQISQMILRKKDRQPIELFELCTSDPKGHKHIAPNLHVCKAAGMPIMVTKSAKLATK